jgi:hypothetical protein
MREACMTENEQLKPDDGSSRCRRCGFVFDVELLGKYGCPNCEGAGRHFLVPSDASELPNYFLAQVRTDEGLRVLDVKALLARRFNQIQTVVFSVWVINDFFDPCFGQAKGVLLRTFGKAEFLRLHCLLLVLLMNCSELRLHQYFIKRDFVKMEKRYETRGKTLASPVTARAKKLLDTKFSEKHACEILESHRNTLDSSAQKIFLDAA